MSTMIDLKEIERKAFRSTYQDGLWDMYMGTVVMAMAIFLYRPEEGYAPINIILAVLICSAAFFLFRLAKKYITLPRMGQVRFGEMRSRKKKNLAIILAVILSIQLLIVILTSVNMFNPAILSGFPGFSADVNLESAVIAAIGSLMVGVSMLTIALVNDFPRGYYIAIMMALAVFLMILINQPIYPLLIGGMIILPGLVLFIIFLKKYPIPQGEDHNE